MTRTGYFLHLLIHGDGNPQSEAERKAALAEVAKYPKQYESTLPEVPRDADIATMGPR